MAHPRNASTPFREKYPALSMDSHYTPKESNYIIGSPNNYKSLLLWQCECDILLCERRRKNMAWRCKDKVELGILIAVLLMLVSGIIWWVYWVHSPWRLNEGYQPERKDSSSFVRPTYPKMNTESWGKAATYANFKRSSVLRRIGVRKAGVGAEVQVQPACYGRHLRKRGQRHIHDAYSNQVTGNASTIRD